MSVQIAFESQSAICTAAGAPFTGRLCRLLGERLKPNSALARRILDWQGNPSHEGDALPLRLAGGLHALARSGRQPEWSAVYPPRQAPDDDRLWSLLDSVMDTEGEWLSPWLDGPPQTNEVGRSALLMSGVLVLAEQFDLPFDLFELGASAGLNSLLDQYSYDLGGTLAGRDGSQVTLKPEWNGVAPPSARVVVRNRSGVDRNPLDVANQETRTKLAAYVWADQTERLTRLEAALAIAASNPVTVEQADAADWLESRLVTEPAEGVCRVVMHTIAYQYFSPQSQTHIREHLARVGAKATENAPVAWLRFEAGDEGGAERRPVLDLTIWPGGQSFRLAKAQPHGAQVDWLV